MQFYRRSYPTYSEKCSMNPRCRNMVVLVAILRGEPQEISTLEVKDKCQTIP
jgi:hypothetical protein